VFSLFAGKTVFAVLLIPKCGSESLRKSSLAIINNVHANNLPRIAFVRDPIERLHSAYRFLARRGYAPKQYESFIDWSLETDDEHVVPQHSYCYPNDTKQFDDLYLLNGLDAVFTNRLGNTIPRLHETHKEPINSDYRMDELRAKYSNDFELVEAAHV